jgi:hypothetical protein
MEEPKTPIHKHEHPVYGWIALVISIIAVLGIAGWCYLAISDGYNDDLVYTVQGLSTPTVETSATSITEDVDVVTEVDAIDSEITGVIESDFDDTQLDDTILGIQ